jgi:serine/threonine protein kinase
MVLPPPALPLSCFSMKQPSHLPPLPTSRLGEYRIIRALSKDKSLLALGHGDAQVVLKMLEPDCLQRGQLHPNIRDRLARVRELAHPGVANLHGVERDSGRPYLVWQYIPGKNLEEFARDAASPDALAPLARELMLTVESLHAQGIVHGAIHPRNIIVDVVGHVRVVDISPLLYDDPAADDSAAIAAIRSVLQQKGWSNSNLAGAMGDASEPPKNLTAVRARLASGMDHTANMTMTVERPVRRSAMLAAIAVMVVGLLIAAGVVWYVAHSAPPPPKPPEVSG